MTGVVVVVALVVAVASYLTWLAMRLDRLALRVEAARGGLVGQLAGRAAAARLLAERGGVASLRSAARAAAAGHDRLRAGGALDAETEDVENALSRALRSPALDALGRDVLGGDAAGLLHEVDLASARVGLARQLYNDAVRDLRALRSRRLVRAFRLSGTRPHPSYFEIEDALHARPPAHEASFPATAADYGHGNS
jgi:hypothetical protein